MDTAQVMLPASSHKISKQILTTDADVDIFKSYLLSKTLSYPNLNVPRTYNSNSTTVSRHSSVYEKSLDFTQMNDTDYEAHQEARRQSLPGGTLKLRQMVFEVMDQRRQFSYLDFETHHKDHLKRHTKSMWDRVFSKSALKDSNADIVKANGVLEILSSKVASIYFLAFLIERRLEATALFIWDCMKSEEEAPMTSLVHHYCLSDSPLLLPALPNVNFEKISSVSKNRDDLIISVSRAISPVLIASHELFLQSTLFLSFESLGRNGVYTKKDQDLAIKTLNRYISAYAQTRGFLNKKIQDRLLDVLALDLKDLNKSEEPVTDPFQNYAVQI